VLLILTPKSLTRVILETVGYVEDWLNVQLYHTLFYFVILVNRGSIKEQVDPFVTNTSTDAVKHFNERLMGERVICLMLSKHPVTFAYSHTYGLTWLVLCPILYKQVIVWIRPCSLLKVSRFEYALVQENKVPSTFNNVVEPLVESFSFVLELFYSLLSLSRDVADLNLLWPQACALHHLKHSAWLNTPVGILAVEHYTALFDTENSPQSLVRLASDKLYLLISYVS
jgi:hypothetical protein